MNQLQPAQPSSIPSSVDYAQRRYRWVGPKGRQWYRAVLMTIIKRHRFSLSMFE